MKNDLYFITKNGLHHGGAAFLSRATGHSDNFRHRARLNTA